MFIYFCKLTYTLVIYRYNFHNNSDWDIKTKDLVGTMLYLIIYLMIWSYSVGYVFEHTYITQ